MNRRSFLRSSLAAPMVILTPGLLMRVCAIPEERLRIGSMDVAVKDYTVFTIIGINQFGNRVMETISVNKAQTTINRFKSMEVWALN